jgi:hypothetical protein
LLQQATTHNVIRLFHQLWLDYDIAHHVACALAFASFLQHIMAINSILSANSTNSTVSTVSIISPLATWGLLSKARRQLIQVMAYFWLFKLYFDHLSRSKA